MGVTGVLVKRMSWMFRSVGVDYENHEAYLIFHIVRVHQLLEVISESSGQSICRPEVAILSSSMQRARL